MTFARTVEASDKCADASERCEDYNDCTVDFCLNGLCYNVPNKTFCDDGNSCTKNDKCDRERCIGTSTNCDDGNPCTVDACVQDQKTCTYERLPDGSPCSFSTSEKRDDPNIPCGFEGTCFGGSCSIDYSTCEDDDPCTLDTCEDGTCSHAYVAIGTPCDDFVPCTANDSCIPTSGDGSSPTVVSCIGAFLNCDDGNPCTDDYCVESTGECENDALVFNGKSCDASSNDKCQTGGACVGGRCDGSPVNCSSTMKGVEFSTCNATVTPDPSHWICTPEGGCELGENFYSFVENISTCDDGDPCTEDDVCNSTSGECAGTPIVCSVDPSISACASASVCSNGSCVATWKSDGTPCDDGDPCTASDVCRFESNASECVGVPIRCVAPAGSCSIARCDDLGNGTSVCIYDDLSDGTPCDDGNPCTEDDSCFESACSGFPMRCSDFNDCTEDYCKNGTCFHYARSENTECSHPGDPCFPTGSCDGNGTCIEVPMPCPAETKCVAGYCF